MVCIVVLQRVMPLCYNKQSDTRHLRIIIRSAHHPGRRVSLARAHVAHLHELQSSSDVLTTAPRHHERD